MQQYAHGAESGFSRVVYMSVNPCNIQRAVSQALVTYSLPPKRMQSICQRESINSAAQRYRYQTQFYRTQVVAVGLSASNCTAKQYQRSSGSTRTYIPAVIWYHIPGMINLVKCTRAYRVTYTGNQEYTRGTRE